MQKIILNIFPVFILLSFSAEAGCLVLGVKKQKENIYYGPTICKGVHLDYLHVYGPLSLLNSEVSDLEVDGPLQLNQSNIAKVTIKDKITQQIVYIKNNSVIQSSLVFSGKYGLALIDDASRINGKVINGKLEKIKNATK